MESPATRDQPSGASPTGVPAAAVSVRQAQPTDLGALAEMIDRCSPGTLARRFHAPFGQAVRDALPALLEQDAWKRSWVAMDGDLMRGIANLGSVAGSAAAVPEAAFLVEDAWFRRGVGAALFCAVARQARRAGLEVVVAFVQGDNERARRFLRSVAPGARASFMGGGELEIRLPVPRCPAGAAPVAPALAS